MSNSANLFLSWRLHQNSFLLSFCIIISRVWILIELLKFVKGKLFQWTSWIEIRKVWRSWICWRHVNAIQSRGEDSKPDIFALAVLESADSSTRPLEWYLFTFQTFENWTTANNMTHLTLLYAATIHKRNTMWGGSLFLVFWSTWRDSWKYFCGWESSKHRFNFKKNIIWKSLPHFCSFSDFKSNCYKLLLIFSIKNN